MGGIAEMIDLRAHLLPGLDDGARTLEESIKICWVSYKDGVRTIMATPHTLNGLYLNDRDTILKKVEELNLALKRFGFKKDLNDPNDPNDLNGICITASTHELIDALRILSGAGVHLCENTLPNLDHGRVMTISNSKKYLFLEFPFQGIPYQSEEIIFQLTKRGIIPIITHPEKNIEIGQRPQRYYEMIRKGCLGQVTAMSLTGEFGPKVRQAAERLLRNRLVHFISSDAHSTYVRPPVISEGVRVAEKIVGKEEAQKMVTEYPQAILEGEKPNIPEPLTPH